MMILIGRLLTSAVIVKNFGPFLFIERVECIFCFTGWIVFGVQSSTPALLVLPSIKRFTFLFARQHSAKWPILPHFAHLFPLAGHSCCRDQFGAPQQLQSFFLNFAGLSGCSFVNFNFRLFTYRSFFSSSVSGESFLYSYIYSCIASVMASTDMSFFLIFLKS